MASALGLGYPVGMVERPIGRAALLVTGTLCAMGCATQRELIDRSSSAGVSQFTFWPPPRSTSLALAPNPLPAQPSGLASAARRIATELDMAGYPEPRWYPIGLKYRHGIAATTRLEAVNDDGTPKLRFERWSSLYPDAANLRWLTLARTVPLPHPGRYRVFLIAVTDLPLGSSVIAPIWSEETVMDGPGLEPQKSSPGAMGQRDLSGYKLGVYVYVYERQQDQIQGAFSSNGLERSATAQLRAAGLARLAGSPLIDAR